jgi:eukaryotic-like serine/threonine-protein kinase
MPWGAALARLIRAAVAAGRGEKEKAIELFALAESDLKAVDMALYAAAARRRRGELIGGDQGRRLIEAADEWMTDLKIKNPLRMAGMLSPRHKKE